MANQLTTWGSSSLAYDADGNLATDGVNTYGWDVRDHLANISGGANASFQYDGLGRRLSKTVNGTSISFLYDNRNVIQELSGTVPAANLIAGLRTDERFQRTDSAGARTFLVDALGSTLALADSSGALQTQYIYEPFGNTTSQGSPSTNPFQYTGRENDATGLYFHRARYNSPGFQRFISEDPIGFRGRLNLFAYASNNPIRFKDSCGLKPAPGGSGSGGDGGGDGDGNGDYGDGDYGAGTGGGPGGGGNGAVLCTCILTPVFPYGIIQLIGCLYLCTCQNGEQPVAAFQCPMTSKNAFWPCPVLGLVEVVPGTTLQNWIYPADKCNGPY